MRVAVVGHVEWVDFMRLSAVPRAGEIVQGTYLLGVPAGGGGVAAVALARFGAQTLFYTSFGDDDLGHRAAEELRRRGVNVFAAYRAEPQRRAMTMIDAERERTIVLMGHRHIARGSDALPWEHLATCDAVYITGGDADAVRKARSAKVVVATSRILPLLNEAGIQVDALVGSDNDAAETYADGDLEPRPHLVVRTDGGKGGTLTIAGSAPTRYAPVQTEVTGDTYGAGDTFAAALTFALGQGKAAADAVAFAAQRAAEVVHWVGPYPSESQQ
jgi:ribokinase